jgi:hypothetical protein
MEELMRLGTHGQEDKRQTLPQGTSPPNMPPSAVTQSRLENVVTCLTMTTNTLQIIADSMQTPFLGAIINTTQAVLGNVRVSLLEQLLSIVKLSTLIDC